MGENRRIAVIDYHKCKSEKCNWLCFRVCPVNRMGKECITKNSETRQPNISEELCTGCGICPKKCPFDAISIINLTLKLGEPIHQFGENTFRVYKLPIPKEKSVIGLIGRNGIGKTTVLNILSGKLTPNLGEYEKEHTINDTINRFRGRELENFFKRIKSNEMKISYKPQNVDDLPKFVSGKVKDLLTKVDEQNKINEISEELRLTHLFDREISQLSGGELQRLSIAATILKDAELYTFDEPSSFLDASERLKIALSLRKLVENGKSVIVIEHDLAVLDYLSDYVHVFVGEPSVYGAVSNISSVRNGINEFLEGYLKTENLRFRETEIKFNVKPPLETKVREELFSYPKLKKNFKEFSLETESGKFYGGEVIGILGPNAIGKTTFVKMLAGLIEPDNEKIDWKLKVSYKPQYIDPIERISVKEAFLDKSIDKEFFNAFIRKKLQIDLLEEKQMEHLSGGELQRVSIAMALSQNADLYLLDEPSAFLDVEQRLMAAHVIRSSAEKREKTCLVVDHDILFQDYVSDRLMIFDGESGKSGKAHKPVKMELGMNQFLKNLNITYRRDPQTGRPRANKPGSVKDQEQKQSGNYYYTS